MLCWKRPRSVIKFVLLAGAFFCGQAWFLLSLNAAQNHSERKGEKKKTESSVFRHPSKGRFWISAQVNVITQGHPPFHAPYSGVNSLKPSGEIATSEVTTLYTGIRASKDTEVIFDLESAGGRGISDALGLAGFTNLDVVRNPELGAQPAVARFFVRQIIPLGDKMVSAERGPLSLATEVPERRLEIVAGKFSLPDFFDVNAAGGDDHLQFMNWTVDNNGAWDYAANTRGYSDGIMVYYASRSWGVRFAEALMPKVANGIYLDADLARSRSENLEFEIHQSLLPGRQGTVRLLSYVNHADMGSYRQAIDAYLVGETPAPDVTAFRRPGRVKYGFGINLEQEIGAGVRIFGRWGWNDGRNESFVYTEVDRTLEFGGDLKGDCWRRPSDKVGLALVSNGISGDHRRYLALGGLGFILGDGALSYEREQIVEAYYTARLTRGVYASLDLQHVQNPGYNRDRGPVFVPAVRLHLEL